MKKIISLFILTIGMLFLFIPKTYATLSYYQPLETTANWDEQLDAITLSGSQKADIINFIDNLIENDTGVRNFAVWLNGARSSNPVIVVKIWEKGVQNDFGYSVSTQGWGTSNYNGKGIIGEIKTLTASGYEGKKYLWDTEADTNYITGTFSSAMYSYNLSTLQTNVLSYLNSATALPTRLTSYANATMRTTTAYTNTGINGVGINQLLSVYQNHDWVLDNNNFNSYWYGAVPLYSSSDEGLFYYATLNSGVSNWNAYNNTNLTLEDNGETYTLTNLGTYNQTSATHITYADLQEIPTYYDIYYPEGEQPIITNNWAVTKSIDFAVDSDNICIDGTCPTNYFNGSTIRNWGSGLNYDLNATNLYYYGEKCTSNLCSYERITSGCAMNFTYTEEDNEIAIYPTKLDCTSAIASEYSAYYVKIPFSEVLLTKSMLIKTDNISYGNVYYNTGEGIIQKWTINKGQAVFISGNGTGNIYVQNSGTFAPTDYYKYDPTEDKYTKLNDSVLQNINSLSFKEINNLDINWYLGSGSIIKNAVLSGNIYVLVFAKNIIAPNDTYNIYTNLIYTNSSGNSIIWYNIGTADQINGNYEGYYTDDEGATESDLIINNMLNPNDNSNLDTNTLFDNILARLGIEAENITSFKDLFNIIWVTIPTPIMNTLIISFTLGCIYIIWRWVRK